MAPKQSTKRELFYLKRNIKIISNHIEHIYDLPFGTCCHYCAYPELYDLEDKLDKQKERYKHLTNKLKKGNKHEKI